jgi:hypothetical protein
VNPQERERPLLEAIIIQWLVKTVTENTKRIPCSGMIRRVALVRNDGGT